MPASHHKHWPYLYHKRRRRALATSSRQMALTQVLSLVGSVIAGVLLENNKATLALIAGTFVVLPGVFDLTGTLGAVLSAKINHHLETTSEKPWKVFVTSTGYTFVISLLAGVIVALAGAAVSSTFFDASFWQVFWLAELAVGLSALIGFPLIGGLSLVFIKQQINPDDVVGPIESSVFDILTVLTLTLVVGWLI